MALAPFFAKTVLSARQVLADFDEAAFVAALEARQVGVAWDAAAAASAEGRATLDLLVDLLARLYPQLAFAPLDEDACARRAPLEAAARAINPGLALTDGVEGADVVVVVGGTPLPPAADGAARRALYAGSDGWTARFSADGPVGSGATDLVFAAGTAACLAAANVFRVVFGAQLATPAVDGDLTWSLLTMAHDGAAASGGAPDGILEVGEVHLVGVGAIGHGAVWAWRRTPRLRGTIHLVDGEHYDRTNPQRYVETPWDAAGPKARASAGRPWASRDAVVRAHDERWETYIARGGPSGDWRVARAALALDSAEARVAVQASLPREVHNAWTRPENLGLSRHDFLAGPCVACLYVGGGPRRNWDEIVAHALGMSERDDVERVRLYLDFGLPLDLDAIAWIADRLCLDAAARARALEFVGVPLATFYARALCGGAVVPLADLAGRMRLIEVPLAFQSALAGVLLAAEVVIEACGLRARPLPARTEVDLLAPLGRFLSSPQGRPASGACLCQDPDFVAAYRLKYGPAADPLARPA